MRPGREDRPPAHLPPPARDVWRELEAAAAPGEPFDPAVLDALPAPVARWLRRSLPTGEPLRSGVRLRMHGEIRLGRWQPFVAEQILTPAGFVWAATAGRFPMRIKGFDRYSGGSGEMRWRLYGLVPVLTATGPDVSRSAAGRHAGEALTLVPAGALSPGVEWVGGDEHRATATVTLGDHTHRVTVDVGADGALREVSFPRWGNPDKGPYGEHRFGVVLRGERSVDSVMLPESLRAGWWPGTDRWADGEFFRATFDDVRHL